MLCRTQCDTTYAVARQGLQEEKGLLMLLLMEGRETARVDVVVDGGGGGGGGGGEEDWQKKHGFCCEDAIAALPLPLLLLLLIFLQDPSIVGYGRLSTSIQTKCFFPRCLPLLLLEW